MSLWCGWKHQEEKFWHVSTDVHQSSKQSAVTASLLAFFSQSCIATLWRKTCTINSLQIHKLSEGSPKVSQVDIPEFQRQLMYCGFGIIFLYFSFFLSAFTEFHKLSSFLVLQKWSQQCQSATSFYYLLTLTLATISYLSSQTKWGNLTGDLTYDQMRWDVRFYGNS